MTLKYTLTDETMEYQGHTLHRIKALKDLKSASGVVLVKKDDLGGWVEIEDNLSQFGMAWVYGNAKLLDISFVCEEAEIFDNAIIRDGAEIRENAVVADNSVVQENSTVRDHATIRDCAVVSGEVIVRDHATICGDATVTKDSDYLMFRNHWSSGRAFTWTRSNDMWKVGCFYGTGRELIAKAYADSETSGNYYEFYVDFVERLKRLG
ncbi:polymer-forming cytoskeletal protein [Enterococcus hirae]|nr:polymer-forming cytoskeletal protein [Enterococcus hirae]